MDDSHNISDRTTADAKTTGSTEQGISLEEAGPGLPTEKAGALPAGVPQFKPGDLIDDRFEVVRFIARGGMGEVYGVEDRQLRAVHVA